MQVTMIVNPRSGRGNAQSGAREIESLLRDRGHEVHLSDVSTQQHILADQIHESDRVVVCGGDGTVHHLLETLTTSQTPLYHYGTGTANLIAKEFGMSKNPIKVVTQLESDHSSTLVDVPTCNGHPFLIMVSMGIDGSVIHRLEESRTQKGGYRAYIKPILQELYSSRTASFSIHTDELNAEPPYQDQGILVVANMRSYGGGFNPCHQADCNDGLLDAVTISCTGCVGAGLKLGSLFLKRTPKDSKRMRSNQFKVISDHAQTYVQIDGEKASQLNGLDDGRLELGSSLVFEMAQKYVHMHTQIDEMK